VKLLNAPFSGNERKKRKAGDRKTSEIESIIKETFNSTILLEIYPRSEISINIHILETDGSVICSIINATTMALIDAGINMKDMIISCSIAIQKQSQQIYLDVTQTEQTWSNTSAYLPIAITSRNQDIVFMQLESRINETLIETALQTAVEGCKKIHAILEQYLKDYVTTIFKKLG
jgi:exosome complex component RRP41